MSIEDWVLLITAGIFAMPFIISNWCAVILWLIKKKASSLVPFIGGISLTIALASTPLHWYGLLGLLADPGVWTGLLGLLFLLKEFIMSSKKNKK